MGIIIKKGRIIDPSQKLDTVGDLYVEGNTISDRPPTGSDITVIDGDGLWVCPGLIDAHVHLREPGQEAKEDIQSGLRAAASGGFTAVLPMPNTSPANDSAAITKMMIEKARALGGVKLYPVAAATRGRLGLEVGDLAALKEAGAVAFSDDGSAVEDDAVMAEVLCLCNELNVPFSQHAENSEIVRGGVLHDGEIAKSLGVKGWPVEGEESIVRRDIALAEKLGAAVHVAHISTKGAVEAVRAAKARGVRVTAEVTPHHLLLTDEAAKTKGTAAKVNPPLRSKEHRDACLQGLIDGTLDIVATDHAPHTAADKEGGFEKAAFGMIGLETAVPLLLRLVQKGALSPARMIEAVSTRPARIFHLPGGTLAPGSVADITVIAPRAAHIIEADTFSSKSRNTPFDGLEVPGCSVITIVDGRVIYRNPRRSGRCGGRDR
jgi:dihydroorotase